MAKVIKKYTIELTEKEAAVLKVLLGKYSDDSKRDLGLDEEDIKSTSRLYYMLPDGNEEE